MYRSTDVTSVTAGDSTTIPDGYVLTTTESKMVSEATMEAAGSEVFQENLAQFVELAKSLLRVAPNRVNVHVFLANPSNENISTADGSKFLSSCTFDT